MASRSKTAACKECKRMKLRCDRQAPCGNCVRRGCQDICPNGALTPRNGTKYTLEGVEMLHSEISRLRARNVRLEEALASVYSQISNEPHPLLIEGQELDSDFPDSSASTTRRADVPNTIDALGTLAIGDRGQSKYFGPSAGTESLFQADHSQTPDATNLPSSQIEVEPRLLRLSSQFPIDLSLDTDSLLLSVIRQFPERLRAWSLCELYTEQFAWASAALLREELIDDYFAPIYKLLETLNGGLDITHAAIRPHRCAVLLLVFALGAWVDLTQDKYWEEADKYYHLARACLSMQSLFEEPECATVQAIYLLSELQGHLTSMTLHPSWTLLSVASKIAQGLGLHRDVSKWNHLDSKTVEYRRHLFWDLAANESFFSLSMGRPPSIRSLYIDAPLPADSGAVDSEGGRLQGFFNWKHNFSRSICFVVTEALVSAIPPSYDDILKLDRRIREFPIPPHLNTLSTRRSNLEESPSRLFQSGLPGILRSSVILALHRTHFSRSLQDPSKNPLLSPFAPSFLAAYRAASWITKCQRVLCSKYPDLLYRLWHPWTHALAACFILGCIVIYVPSNPIAESALPELNAMCAIYEVAALKTTSLRTKNGWKLLQKIQSRAKESYSEYVDGKGSNSPSNISFPTSNFGDDELALFGGQTRILVTKSSPPLTSNQPHLQALPQTLVVGENMNIDVHPSLLQFLYTAPVTPLASLNDPDNEFAPPQDTAGSTPFGFMAPMAIVPLLPSMPADFPTMHRDAQFDLPLYDTWQSTEYEGQNGLGGMEDQWRAFLQQLGLDQSLE